MATWEAINSLTVENDTTTLVTFTSIPQTYLHLQVTYTMTNFDNSNSVMTKYNGNTGNHFRQTNYGVESAKYDDKYAGQDGVYTAGHNYGNGGVNDFTLACYTIYDYTDTNKQKAQMGFSTKQYTGSGLTIAQNQMFAPFFGSGPYIYLESGGYSGDDAALTSLTLANAGGASKYFGRNSRFNLYGIKSS